MARSHALTCCSSANLFGGNNENAAVFSRAARRQSSAGRDQPRPLSAAWSGGQKRPDAASFGDWPYSQVLFDNSALLLNSINQDPDVSLVMHVGVGRVSAAMGPGLASGESSTHDGEVRGRRRTEWGGAPRREACAVCEVGQGKVG
jgi:hypothetical protein